MSRPAFFAFFVNCFLVIPMLASIEDDYFDDHWEEFDELVDTGGYVDKTPLLQYFIAQRRHLALLIPPKMGRTTNMLMMRRFYEVPIMPLDEKYKPIRKPDPWNKTIFKDLAVCKQRTFCDKHFGKYPVIYLDFSDLNTTTPQTFYHSLRYMTTYMFGDHDYLRNSEILSEKEVDKFIAYRHPRPPVEDEFVIQGGWLLSVWLQKHFNQSCIVLIDNFDHPATILLNGTETQKKQYLNYLRPLQEFVVKLVRGNDRVHHSLFTALSKIDEYLTKEMTSLVYTDVLRTPELNPYYGFSEAELKSVLKKFKRMEQFQIFRTMLHKYKTDDGRAMYNAFSMHDYMELEEEEEKRKQKQREKEKKLKGSGSQLLHLVGLSSYSSGQKRREKFEDIIKSGGYVDKSRLVDYFISSKQHLVVLAPAKFGKSLNIEMLSKFFQIKLHRKTYAPLDRDVDDFSVFNGLSVCQDKAFCNKHYANYPVISMDFADFDVSHEAGFYNSFREVIHKLAKRYDYLEHSEELDPEDKDMYKDYRYPKPPMRDGHVAYAPYVLSRLLGTHFNKTVMVFIDNFDAPATALMQEMDNKFKLGVLHTLYDLVSDLVKKNPYVEYSLFSAVDMMVPRNLEELVYVPAMEDRTVSQFYGFKESEIRDLLWKFNSGDHMMTAKKMFDGKYHARDSGARLYRTFSVIKFLEEVKKNQKKTNEGDENQEKEEGK